MTAVSHLSEEVQMRLAALQTQGAADLDPVRMRFIEALARRVGTAQGRLREVLEARLQQAMAQLMQSHEAARGELMQSLPACLQRFPQAASQLQQLADAGQFNSLRREIARLQSSVGGSSLAALTRELEQELAKHASDRAPRAELKTVQAARGTWAALSVERQLMQALKDAPPNAGPINSHMLLLRSLEMMREISPDYLHRFIAHTDALLRLDTVPAEKTEKPEKAKKPKARKPRKEAQQD